jgi:hypothetical protein
VAERRNEMYLGKELSSNDVRGLLVDHFKKAKWSFLVKFVNSGDEVDEVAFVKDLDLGEGVCVRLRFEEFSNEVLLCEAAPWALHSKDGSDLYVMGLFGYMEFKPIYFKKYEFDDDGVEFDANGNRTVTVAISYLGK